VGGWFLVFYELELLYEGAIALSGKQPRNVARRAAKVPIFLVNIDMESNLSPGIPTEVPTH
jgi:hypothetical protein